VGAFAQVFPKKVRKFQQYSIDLRAKRRILVSRIAAYRLHFGSLSSGVEMRNLGIILILSIVLFSLNRCHPLVYFAAGGAAGVGGYRYYQGDLTVAFQAPYPSVWDATVAALGDMGFEIESAQDDVTYGKVIARRANNSPVTVSLEHASANTTKAVIRVGHLGDKEVSLAIKEQIEKALIGQ
jgi:hypothetical protein